MSTDIIPPYMKTPNVFYPKREVATNDLHQHRAAIRAAKLGTCLADVRLKTRCKMSREGIQSREISRFIEEQAKAAFIAGAEAQSDALQSEWAEKESRIAMLEERLAYQERIQGSDLSAPNPTQPNPTQPNH